MGKLTELRLIKQPENTPYCGAACIGMVLIYFNKSYGGVEEIWSEISDNSSTGRIYCKTYKIGKFIETMGLAASIIRYSNLNGILEYCEKKQIPAILNHHSFENASLGHFTVFVKHNVNSIIIRDPENENRHSVNINDLEKAFLRNNDNDEIGGKIIILVSENLENRKTYECPKCTKQNSLDIQVFESGKIIESLICTNCDSPIELYI